MHDTETNDVCDWVNVNNVWFIRKSFTPCPTFDISGIEDKFANSILHAATFGNNIDTEIYHKWREQSHFDIGFVPIDEQICLVV